MADNIDEINSLQEEISPEENNEKKTGSRNILLKIIRIIIIMFFCFIIIYIIVISFRMIRRDNNVKKPVIYLYPTDQTDVNVNITFDGELTCTYPDVKNGWDVTAYPDGRIINKADGKEYSYLYWEGKSKTKYDLSKGFVVKGEDTAEFLQEKLSYMGLTPKEYNEFIVYWLPEMQNNKYNLITFQGEKYTESAKLKINPQPDSILRIFMAYKPLKKPINIEEQELETFERKGFCVVEWGGCKVK